MRHSTHPALAGIIIMLCGRNGSAPLAHAHGQARMPEYELMNRDDVDGTRAHASFTRPGVAGIHLTEALAENRRYPVRSCRGPSTWARMARTISSFSYGAPKHALL